MKHFRLTGIIIFCLFIGLQLCFVSKAQQPQNPLKSESYSCSRGDNSLFIEYPVSGNAAFLDSVRSWINSGLGDSYKGSLNDGKALFDHYADSIVYNTELDEYDGCETDSISVEYQTEKFVTYNASGYWYGGGAHGMFYSLGRSFLFSNGDCFGYDCFSSLDELNVLVREAFKKNYGFTSDQEFCDSFFLQSIDDFHLPEWDPWLTAKGIEFRFSLYESGAYAEGLRDVIISYDVIKSYLNSKGLSFF